MKFWQKAYICIIIIFLIGFDVAVFLFVQKSYALNTREKYATAENERYVVQASLHSRISSISELYRELNSDNLKMYVRPYGDYYVSQNIYIELYHEDSPVFSNFPYILYERPELAVGPGEKGTVTREINGTLYYFVAGRLDEPYSDLKFVYIKNIQDLADYKKEMLSHAVVISVVVSVFLSALVLGMLLKLTAPIRRLNIAAEEIAGGHYQKRVEVRSKDEIGDFAYSFNTMADSVEAHIQKLSDLTEERQRFINNLAHEMRTPITAVMGYGEFLKCASYSDEEKVKAIDYIIHQSERLKNMARKLMELADLNNKNLHLERIDLRKIAERVEQTLAGSLSEKGIRIKKQFQRTRLRGDKDLLESLVLNIIENSVRAMPEGGKIEVGTSGGGGELTLYVSDNGLGIRDSELRKIFEPFYRVDKSRSRSFGGAGLGLAICKRICDLHGARMNVTSKPGAGTRVEIKFTSLMQADDDSEI